MGSAIFDFDNKLGTAASGTALKRMLISPLAKTKRIRNSVDIALKKAIKLCSQLGGENIVDLSKEKINIFWQDGLPNDDLEEANIMNVRTGGKATISQYSAIKRLDNLTDEDAQSELDAIQVEESVSNPMKKMKNNAHSHKVKITENQEGRRKIYIDDMELKQVTGMNISIQPNRKDEITFTILCDVEYRG